jgi:hypothetical protein
MAGRVDRPQYGAGCHAMRNFIPDIAGPAIKRGGSHYVQPVKTESRRSWLMPFVFTASESFVLEFGHNTIRFYFQRAPLLISAPSAYNNATAYTVGDLVASGGVNYYCVAATTGNAPPNTTYWHALTGLIYEIPSPWSESDLVNADGGFALNFQQSADVIYIAGGGKAPRKLSRFGNTLWTLDTYTPIGGPFNDVNITATTVYASASTGTVTLTASTSIFTSDRIGTLFYLEQKTVSDTLQWETNKSITAGDKRRASNRNYVAVNTDTTGTVTPVHTEGSVYDGDSGVQWTFLDSGYGWARITAVSGTTATATVLSRIPDGAVLVGNASTKWAFGAWSDAQGWPTAVAFYLDRLCFGRDSEVWMSVSGDYENLKDRDEGGRQTTESAVSLTLPSRRGSPILWMEALDNGLVVGTGSDEWVIGPASRNDPFGPLNVATTPLGAIGSRQIPVLRMFDSVAFVQRSGRRLRDMRYIPGEGALRADLNAFADHITGEGIVSLAYAKEPFSVIWAVLADGGLVACMFYPEQESLGWAQMPFDGVVECVETIPSPDGRVDDVWMIVRRTIGGVTRRYVEWLGQPLRDDEDQADAFYVDSGITYSGGAVTTVTGLGHLEGKEVAILPSGATHPPRTVSGGQVALQVSATKVQVGLPVRATLAGMDIESGAATGTAQGKTKRIHRVAVRLHRTLGGKMGPTETNLSTIQYRTAADPMGTAPPLYTGDKEVTWPGGSTKNARVWFVHEDPMPCTVLAFMPQMGTEDAP